MKIVKTVLNNIALEDIDLELERVTFVFDNGTRITAYAASRGEPDTLMLHGSDGRLIVIPAVSNEILVKAEPYRPCIGS